MVNPSQKFESLEIKDAVVNAVGEGWLVIMHVRNTGTTEAKISHIDVNGTTELNNAEGLVISTQSEAEVWVKLNNPPYQRETTAKITIHTTNGNQYIQLVVIPKFGFSNE